MAGPEDRRAALEGLNLGKRIGYIAIMTVPTAVEAMRGTLDPYNGSSRLNRFRQFVLKALGAEFPAARPQQPGGV